jgi:ABC-type Fe3+ transport system substrate-binding protein
MAIQLTKTKQCEAESGMSFDLSLSQLVELDIQISDMKLTLERKEREREAIVKALVKKNITHEGDWSLIPKVQVRHQVVNKKLQLKFPQIYADIAKIKISVGDLRKRLGEDDIISVCTSKEYTQYVTVFDPQQRG